MGAENENESDPTVEMPVDGEVEVEVPDQNKKKYDEIAKFVITFV